MQVKWNCLLKRVIIPIIIAIIAGLIVIGSMMAVVWVYYTFINPDYMSQPRIYNSNTEAGQSFLLFITPVIMVMGIVFIISWLRESMKPCVIKEDKVVDKIAWGFVAFIGFIQFIVCAWLFITGVILCIVCLSIIISILCGRIGDIIPGIIVFILTIITFAISWFIYPYKQTNNQAQHMKDDENE
jgi:hypothetical protein